MSQFDPEVFMSKPDGVVFFNLRKEELVTLGRYLQLRVRKSMMKTVIQAEIVYHLVDIKVFGIAESGIMKEKLNWKIRRERRRKELQERLEEKKQQGKLEREEKERQGKLEREENKRQEKLEREEKERQERLEREEKEGQEKLEREEKEWQEKWEREEKERQERLEKEKMELQLQHEIEMKKLEVQLKLRSDPTIEKSSAKFDVTKHIMFVPPFQQTDVDNYFLHFEKVAGNLKWPKEYWVMSLQSELVGKAREIYIQLSVEQATSYDTVKELILKGYLTKPFTAFELARANLSSFQKSMMKKYDVDAVEHNFKPGQKVLALLRAPGNLLNFRSFGPYVIQKKLSTLNYLVTPDRRKQTEFLHVNLLKPYVKRSTDLALQPASVNVVVCEPEELSNELSNSHVSPTDTSKLTNINVLRNLDSKLCHLSESQCQDLEKLLLEFEHLFPDVPTRTDQIYHDFDVGNADPVKQYP